MSKTRSAAIRGDIGLLAAAIYRKSTKLDDAGKKELAFIHKHLRKAAKAIERSAGKAKPSRKKKKKTPAPRTRKPRATREAPVKTRPPLKPQGTA